MAVQNFGDGGFVLTGDHIAAFRLRTLLRAMELEVKTGMTMTSRSKANPFKIVRQEYGIKARNKAAVLEEFRSMLAAQNLL